MIIFLTKILKESLIFLNKSLYSLILIILTNSRKYTVGTMALVLMKESHMKIGPCYLRTSLAAKDVVIARWAMYPVKLLANLYQPYHLHIYHVLPIKQR